MRGKSLLNEKAIIILSLNQSECLKLLRSVSSRIGFSRDTGIEESACKSSYRPLFLRHIFTNPSQDADITPSSGVAYVISPVPSMRPIQYVGHD